MRIVAIAAVIVAAAAGTLALAQQENTTQVQPENAVQVQPLSPRAMEALVAGIAFYPDAVIEQVLDASQYPDAIAEAVAGTAAVERQQAWPASVKSLVTSPEILRQLKENATITARLALAARTQLAAVWSAIDRVRTQFESAQADTATEVAASGAIASSGVLYPTGAFVAGYWTAQVIDEIGAWYTTTAPIVYQTNPDGSVSFGRSAETNASSSAGSTNVQHSGSGAYTGQGTGSYSGSTDIESTHGDASVNTTAADGQVSSTITTGQGEKTVTLGDEQVGDGSGPASQRNTGRSTSRMSRPSSVPGTNSRFSQANATQLQAANRALGDSWSRVSAGTKNVAGMNSILTNLATVHPQSTPQFARPKTSTIGTQNVQNSLRSTGGQAPSRKVNNGPSHKPTGGGGGRRGRR